MAPTLAIVAVPAVTVEDTLATLSIEGGAGGEPVPQSLFTTAILEPVCKLLLLEVIVC